MLKKFIILIAVLAVNLSAFAHTTVVKKNTPTGFAERSEIEGSSGIVNAFSISHGCAAPDSQIIKPVKSQSIVFPNGADSLSQRSDNGEFVILADHIVGNAIMSAKPIQDYNVFKTIAVTEGSVPAYNSHGLKTRDVRAFRFRNGRLQTDLVGIIPFRASFPSFRPESCAQSLKIQIAIANYCTRSQTLDNRADVWIGELTGKFNDADVVSVGFWPSMSVLRDLENNPLPGHCQDGFEIVVTPSSSAIDRYLPLRDYWPS